MCGRFTLKTPPDQWGQLLLPISEFQAVLEDWKPRYNVAPTQNILAIAREGSEPLYGSWFRWGLVPPWSDDAGIGNRMINARSETLAEKRSFSSPLKKRRCLILADGYYEWQKRDQGSKQPVWIAPRAGGIMYLAGLWEVNRRATGHPLHTCTIITTAANAQLAEIHDRMPVVLKDDTAAAWMDPECDSQSAVELLKPLDDDSLQTQYVGTHVNNPRNDDPGCLVPEKL